MKKLCARYFFVLFTLISVSSGLRSQDLFVDAAGERIQVCTDRTMYISGEKVFFSAVFYNIKDRFAEEFSRAYYCELITPDGKKIAGWKYPLQNSCGHGCLTIPEGTISGIYFLKFYTRFMRNTGTEDYKYIMLKIVNPFKTEVLSGNKAFDTTELAGNKMKISVSDQSLKILSSKDTFSPREDIQLNISVDTGKILPARLCLSVIPESTFIDSFSPDKIKPDTAKKGVYFPETRGISLSGKLIGKESGKPVPDAKVNLSIIGDKDFFVVRTDSSGRFFFALPDYNGRKDIFLCADDLPDIKPEILIDNDFCSRPVSIPSPRFTLNEEEIKAAFKLAVNLRISSMFNIDTIASDSMGEQNKVPFYGKPSEVLVMEKYIDLPTLGEYFNELPGAVSVRKVQGKKQFRFYTTRDEMSLYDPLVLVDWVAVNDIEKILSMSPFEIERIELVNSPYIKGKMTYGGIISFISKNNDFAGIDLPTSGTFVNYSFLEKRPEEIPLGQLPNNIPDSRNTIYWNPAVQINVDGTAVISFHAPDTPGKYDIMLRAMSKTGKVVSTKETIVIVNN